MANQKLGAILRRIQELVGRAAGPAAEDAQLLEQFTRNHEEAPFAALVQRHGAIVLGVCRRVLRNPHDADDAFQATFLVLARRAGSIRQPGALAGWLYRVAYHIAVKARASAAKRQAHEMRATDMGYSSSASSGDPPSSLSETGVGSEPDPLAEATVRELHSVLDEELFRLPEKYRVPVVLCCLEGKTYAEAAEQLAWPMDSLKTRLSRARELLRDRLTRRGLALSAGALAAMLESGQLSAAVPPSLAGSTAKVAALYAAGQAATGALSTQVVGLADQMLQTLWLSKVKVAGALLLLVVACLSAGALAHRSLAGKPPAQTPAIARPTGYELEHEDVVRTVKFSPDGSILAAGCRDHTIALWNTANGRRLGVLRGHAGAVDTLVFSADGKILASGAEGDDRILIWDMAGRQQRGSLAGGHPRAFSADGSRLAGFGPEQRVKTWELATATPLSSVQLLDPTPLVPRAGSADGRTVAAVDARKTLKAWDVRFWLTRRDLQRLSPRFQVPNTTITCLTFSPDGARLATGGIEGDRTVKLWDAATGKVETSLPHPMHVTCLAFTADARTLATACGDRIIRLWDLDTASERCALRETSLAAALALSADGNILATVGREAKTVQLRPLPVADH